MNGCRTRQIFSVYKTQVENKNKATMVYRPPPPFIMNGCHPELPPRRAAQPISSADSGGRSVAARRSWMAPGMSAAALLSLTQQFTVYKVGYWKYPINQQEECFGGSIVPYMHRTPLDIVGFERKGGEVVEL